MKYTIEFNKNLNKHIARPDRDGQYSWPQARSELKRLNVQTAVPAKTIDWISMDIDSGLGIGGYGSEDFNIHTETDNVEDTGPMTGHPRHNGCGQLWEDCPACGQQPVHLDCGYCDRHCQC